MGFRCGIVGLPNAGKSTLFNALTKTAAAQAENYPFCTIEPNIGNVPVIDPRLDRLASIALSENTVYACTKFVDIAGLVKGAAKGEGLGNRFLGNIRDVDAVVYVLRCFENDDIAHVENRIDPVSDFEIIETELMLADLESLEKRRDNFVRKVRGGEREAKSALDLLDRVHDCLCNGKSLRTAGMTEEEHRLLGEPQLLTAKPVLFVANVDESSAADGNEFSQQAGALAARENAAFVTISAKIESELAQLEPVEQQEYMACIGLEDPGLDRLVRAGHDLLGLRTFFTAGPREARAWTIRRGSKAPEAAGVIHTDFQKGFIRAEVISYDDYMDCNGETGAKEAGRMRLEGKDYIVRDGDVMLFRFNT